MAGQCGVRPPEGNVLGPTIHVTDKVEDFVEDKCYAINCILKLFPRPGFIYLFVSESKRTFNTDGVKEMTGSMLCEWIHVLHIYMTGHNLSFIDQDLSLFTCGSIH